MYKAQSRTMTRGLTRLLRDCPREGPRFIANVRAGQGPRSVASTSDRLDLGIKTGKRWTCAGKHAPATYAEMQQSWTTPQQMCLHSRRQHCYSSCKMTLAAREEEKGEN